MRRTNIVIRVLCIFAFALDIFVPAGGPYIPTLFFRTAGSANPWSGPARKLPEYRTTAGGNDFYTDRQ